MVTNTPWFGSNSWTVTLPVMGAAQAFYRLQHQPEIIKTSDVNLRQTHCKPAKAGDFTFHPRFRG
jgi:hypothetical protein